MSRGPMLTFIIWIKTVLHNIISCVLADLKHNDEKIFLTWPLHSFWERLTYHQMVMI